METEEIWKDVVGYEGLYEVSNLGRIKSIARLVRQGGRRLSIKEIILKSPVDTPGYPTIGLHKNGTKRTVQVHSLVAIAFLGHTPCGLEIVIDHINGIKTDPRAENLRIVTHRFNCAMGERKDKDKSTSKYPGVCWSNIAKKWMASIRINKKSKHLGYFKNEIDAANIYQKEFLKIQILNGFSI